MPGSQVPNWFQPAGRPLGPNVRPDLIQAIALLMANPCREEGQQDLEVRADDRVSMNRRQAKRIVDHSVDLLTQPRNLAPAEWRCQAADAIGRGGPRKQGSPGCGKWCWEWVIHTFLLV
ncbi:MAG: HTTM domain-containing protein [Actinomycetia bacterium]|nr:HTTM domain-containing protein [Actinomycetes bacterium]